MPSADDPSRIVAVNINRDGRFHERDCKWLKGVLGNNPGLQKSYETMQASQMPAGKEPCSRCDVHSVKQARRVRKPEDS